MCIAVPEGPGKGTLDYFNGIRATEYLIKAERIRSQQPFAWVLFRPPWAYNNKCCKACVLHHMKNRLENEVSVSLILCSHINHAIVHSKMHKA